MRAADGALDEIFTAAMRDSDKKYPIENIWFTLDNFGCTMVTKGRHVTQV